MIKRAFLLGWVAALFTSLSDAQDEETPEKPQTLAEAKAEFAEADKALNDAYSKTKKALPEYEFEDLRKDQRGWLAYRDQRVFECLFFDHGVNAEKIGKDKAKESPHYWAILADLTESRIAVLGGWRGIGDPDSLTGRYVDGYGGYMELVQDGDKLCFSIEVVRGPTYHLGRIGGVAKINANMARFSDAGRAEDIKAEDEDETWLTFIDRGRKIEVIGTNTLPYHGARAYFDGRYIRVAELTDKEAAKLKKSALTNNWPEEH